MLVAGTLFHMALAVLISAGFYKFRPRLYITVPVLISIGFALKELGEAKYKIAGSIKDLSKNIDMLEMVFTEPQVIMQWALPGLAAFGLWFIMRGRNDSV